MSAPTLEKPREEHAIHFVGDEQALRQTQLSKLRISPPQRVQISEYGRQPLAEVRQLPTDLRQQALDPSMGPQLQSCGVVQQANHAPGRGIRGQVAQAAGEASEKGVVCISQPCEGCQHVVNLRREELLNISIEAI